MLQAQLPTPYFEHIQLDNGTSVSDIVQDHEGYLWFATFAGLARFDGYSAKYFRASSDPNTLTDERVRSLLEDSSGTLWVGTYSGGLNKFNRSCESFSALRMDLDNPHALQSDGILALYEDSKGNIWVGTYGGGISIIPKAEKDSLQPKMINYLNDPNDPSSLSDNTVMSFLEDTGGNMWVATWNGGLNLVNGPLEDCSFRRFQHDPSDPQSLSNNTTFDLLEDSQGRFWISSWGGGLNRLVKQADGDFSFLHYRHEPDNPYSLSGDVASALYEDTDGTVWVATYGAGLNRLIDANPESTHSFIRYRNISGSPHGQLNEEVFCLYEDNQKNLWIL